MTRTHDLLITNQLHYRLCYTSDLNIIIYFTIFVKDFFIKFENSNKKESQVKGAQLRDLLGLNSLFSVNAL